MSRSVQRLLQAELIDRERITYDQASYCHVYYPIDPQTVASETRRTLNDWYSRMERLIRRFKHEYEGPNTSNTDCCAELPVVTGYWVRSDL